MKKLYIIYQVLSPLLMGLFFILVSGKYIGSYLPDREIVGIWLYFFHLCLGIVVMFKGIDWAFEGLDKIKKIKEVK